MHCADEKVRATRRDCGDALLFEIAAKKVNVFSLWCGRESKLPAPETVSGDDVVASDTLRKAKFASRSATSKEVSVAETEARGCRVKPRSGSGPTDFNVGCWKADG